MQGPQGLTRQTLLDAIRQSDVDDLSRFNAAHLRGGTGLPLDLSMSTQFKKGALQGGALTVAGTALFGPLGAVPGLTYGLVRGVVGAMNVGTRANYYASQTNAPLRQKLISFREQLEHNEIDLTPDAIAKIAACLPSQSLEVIAPELSIVEVFAIHERLGRKVFFAKVNPSIQEELRSVMRIIYRTPDLDWSQLKACFTSQEALGYSIRFPGFAEKVFAAMPVWRRLHPPTRRLWWGLRYPLLLGVDQPADPDLRVRFLEEVVEIDRAFMDRCSGKFSERLEEQADDALAIYQGPNPSLVVKVVNLLHRRFVVRSDSDLVEIFPIFVDLGIDTLVRNSREFAGERNFNLPGQGD